MKYFKTLTVVIVVSMNIAYSQASDISKTETENKQSNQELLIQKKMEACVSGRDINACNGLPISNNTIDIDFGYGICPAWKRSCDY